MPLQEHEIPTVVILNNETDAFRGIANSTIFDLTNDGEELVFIDFSLYNVDLYDVVEDIVEFVTKDFYTSFDVIDVEFFRKELSTLDKNILCAVLTTLKNLKTLDVHNEFYINSYLQTILSDVGVTFRINLGKVLRDYDTEVEMYIWGTNFFNTKAEVFCACAHNVPTLNTDLYQESGRIIKFDSDIYTANSKLSWLNSYICNSDLAIKSIDSELNNRSGRLSALGAETCTTQLGLLGGFPTDFKTRSLFTGDFFLETDRFTTASAIVWVDVVDYLYPINVSNTYLSVNDTMVSGIWFEDIPNGKRLYYDPSDNFYSNGVLVYTLHAESSVGEIEEKDFYLLYGYNVIPNEVLDWGPNNRVVVRLEAQNLAFCPNKTGEAFDFTTVDLKSFNLHCSINPVGYVDLPATIASQSKTFYYGKTYTIKLKRVKDYAGNIMPDFEYKFTIEDPNA